MRFCPMVIISFDAVAKIACRLGDGEKLYYKSWPNCVSILPIMKSLKSNPWHNISVVSIIYIILVSLSEGNADTCSTNMGIVIYL